MLLKDVTGRLYLLAQWAKVCVYAGVKWIRSLRLKVFGLMGSLLNLAGAPGIVRDCEYFSEGTSTRVTVRRTALYTVVTVNGTDVYFYRLSGGIDGVGATLTSGCKVAQAPESAHFAVGHEYVLPIAPKCNGSDLHG